MAQGIRRLPRDDPPTNEVGFGSRSTCLSPGGIERVVEVTQNTRAYRGEHAVDDGSLRYAVRPAVEFRP